MPTLLAHDLNHHFPNGPHWLKDWSATWEPSGVHLIEGGDGAGKTTLLRLLAGAVPLVSGRLCLNQYWLDTQPDAYRAQVFWSDPHSTQGDDWGARVYLSHQQQVHPRTNPEALALYLDRFGLLAHLDKPLYALSTGTRRKLKLAAALASGAPLTLIDEPLAALDRRSIVALQEALVNLAHVSHRLILLAHPGGPADWDGVPLASHRVLNSLAR